MPKIKVSSGSYDGAGRFIPGCKVTILDAGTTDLSTIYSDQAGTALGNPFTADDSGTWEFYSDPGLFDISVQRRGSAIFSQDSVAIGFVPYIERPGGSFSASSLEPNGAILSESTSPYLKGENAPFTLGTGIGNPVTFRDTGLGPSVIKSGVDFKQSKNPTGIEHAGWNYVAMRYNGDFVRDFICYFTVSHFPTFWGSQALRVVTVDGDDWEAGTYTQKTVSDVITYTWDATRIVAFNQHMQVVVVHVEPEDVVVPLIYMQDSFTHYIPDVSLAIKP